MIMTYEDLFTLFDIMTTMEEEQKSDEFSSNPVDFTNTVGAAEYAKGGIIDTPNLGQLPVDCEKPFIYDPDLYQETIRSVMLLFNPFSGKGAAKRLVKKTVIPALNSCKEKVEIHVVESEGPKFFTNYLIGKKQKILDLNINMFIVVGGDGTYNEFINGYLGAHWKRENIPVMFLSGGTGNGFCHHIGQTDKKSIKAMVHELCRRIESKEPITTQWMDCMELIVTSAVSEQSEDGVTSTSKVELQNVEEKKEESNEEKENNQVKQPMEKHDHRDVVSVQSKRESSHLLYAISQTHWGIIPTAEKTAETMRWMGVIRYKIASLFHILKAYARNIKLTMYFDETETNTHEVVIDIAALTIMKIRYMAKGYKISPLAKLDNGMLDIFILPHVGRKHTLDLFGLVSKGTHILNADPKKGPFYFRCRKITLEPLNECHDPVSLDGEEGPQTPVTIQVLPKAVPIVYFG